MVMASEKCTPIIYTYLNALEDTDGRVVFAQKGRQNKSSVSS